MGRRWRSRWMWIAGLVLVGGVALAARLPSTAAAEPGSATVVLDGRPVFAVSAAPTGMSVAERASLIDHRLAQVTGDPGVRIDDLQIQEEGAGDRDRRWRHGAGVRDGPGCRRRRPHARGVGGRVARGHSCRGREGPATPTAGRQFIVKVLDALGALLVLVVIIAVEQRVYRLAVGAIVRRRASGSLGVKLEGGELLGADQLGPVLLVVSNILRWLIIALVFYAYVTFNLRFVPGAGTVQRALREFVTSPFVAIWGSIIAYLPNLFFVVVIACLAYAAIRLSNFIFDRIDQGTITFGGFHRDLALPTAKLVRFALFIVALVAMFPYLPGAKSPAFQGISIFLGILLSFGSSSAIANIISGIILIYMRPFQSGDRVSIAGTVGDVVERTILVTRIRTVKNEVITIPNAAVMGAHIINFSTATQGEGLILHTTITIGYDAPWRTVHELLIGAARATPGVLPAPAPFVLQTALDDFYVAYQLNAYTADATRMAFTYSALHANIQDGFNAGGIEINSPHYGAIRDGNRTAVPDDYLPAGYRPAGFRIDAAGPVPRDPAPTPDR